MKKETFWGCVITGTILFLVLFNHVSPPGSIGLALLVAAFCLSIIFSSAVSFVVSVVRGIQEAGRKDKSQRKEGGDSTGDADKAKAKERA